MPEYLKIPELADRLDVSEKTARTYVKTGVIPSAFIGGAYRVSEEDLEAFVESRRSKPPKALARPSGSPAAQDPGVRAEAVIDMVLDGMRKQRDLERQAVNRALASEGVQAASMDPENEVNARLRELTEEDKDEALIDLVKEVLRLQDENAALQEAARARV